MITSLNFEKKYLTFVLWFEMSRQSINPNFKIIKQVGKNKTHQFVTFELWFKMSR